METEVKIPVADLAAVRERLQGAGFHVAVPRTHEVNDLYDSGERSLREKGSLLRLRQAGKKAVITWKGPAEAGPHKSRPELETTVGSLETTARIFEQLGYQRLFRYEKYRTEYVEEGRAGVVTVDETPIGNFLEIEGSGEWIDATAERLGFQKTEYVLESYGQLYLDRCRRSGMEPRDMVFSSPLN